MTHIATLGTSSCATIAIGGFKDGQKDANEVYIADPKTFKGPKDGMTVAEFSSKILYPVSQPLGKTGDYPFQRLMEELDKSNMSSKLVMATLNEHQFLGAGQYWHHQLKKHGFKLITKASNNWGSVNYIYMRNPSEVEITKEEAAA